MKKKSELRYVILILFMITAIVLGFVSKSVNQNRKLNFLESMIKDSVVYINKILTKPILYIDNYIKDSKEKNDLLKKYKKLKEKEEIYNLQSAKIKELETVIQKMEKTLELNKNLTNYSHLNANVLNRNLGYWFNTITIDAGKNKGLEIDMAVIVPSGLIGRIKSLSNFTSTVELLTSEEVINKISVKIKTKDKDVYGILTKYNGDFFIVEGIEESILIDLESEVVTTGMGGVFPSGILIGNVSSIETDHFDLAKTVYVKSQVDFNDLTNVTVLKRSNK